MSAILQTIPLFYSSRNFSFERKVMPPSSPDITSNLWKLFMWLIAKHTIHWWLAFYWAKCSICLGPTLLDPASVKQARGLPIPNCLGPTSLGPLALELQTTLVSESKHNPLEAKQVSASCHQLLRPKSDWQALGCYASSCTAGPWGPAVWGLGSAGVLELPCTPWCQLPARVESACLPALHSCSDQSQACDIQYRNSQMCLFERVYSTAISSQVFQCQQEYLFTFSNDPQYIIKLSTEIRLWLSFSI